MLPISFANPLGPQSGPLGDGVIFGSLPQVAPVTALSLDHLRVFSKVFRGNADAAGSLTWSEVTAAANNDAAGDVSLFDTVNPIADRLAVELSDGDEVDGVSFLVSTAAALSGTPVADVFYRTTTGWASAVGIVTPSFTSTGLKRLTFLKSQSPDTPIRYSDIAPVDHVIDPRNQPQMRCLFIQFSGITAVTTAPLFTRVWKTIRHSASHKAKNLTGLIAQEVNPVFSSAQAATLPLQNDLLLFGFDERPVRLFPTIHRPANSAHTTEWVYSKSDGTVAAIPATRITDTTDRLATALIAGAAVTWVPGSFVAAAWTDLAPNVPVGQVIEPAVLGRLAISAARLFGAFIGDPDLAATAVEYVGTHTDLRGDNLRTWYIWLLDGTTTKLVRLRFRLGGSEGKTLQYFADSWHKLSNQSAVLGAGTVENIGGAGHNWNTTPFALINSDPGYGLASLTGTIQPSVIGTSQIPLSPPSDWGKASVTDEASVAHTRYWIGLRTTGDTQNPILPENFTLKGQPVKGVGITGLSAPETATYTQVSGVMRDTSLTESRLLVVNATTGQAAEVVVTANAAIANNPISLSVTKGDTLLLVQPIGHPSVNVGDGFLLLA